MGAGDSTDKAIPLDQTLFYISVAGTLDGKGDCDVRVPRCRLPQQPAAKARHSGTLCLTGGCPQPGAASAAWHRCPAGLPGSLT